MINYDPIHKQILSSACLNCCDDYFKAQAPLYLKVGCCSYSPVFTLFEIYKMLQADQIDYFFEHIYHNFQNTIRPYEIVIHAHVHPHFHDIDLTSLSSIEREDTRIKYSVCQFFVEDKGCSLPPDWKTSICRSFICSAIETHLNSEVAEKLVQWVKLIRFEAKEFNTKHQTYLEQQGWDLITSHEQVIAYLLRTS